MWKQGGRSAALDRAQALLSGRRTSRGDAESKQAPAAETSTHTIVGGGHVRTRPAPPNSPPLFSDLSELSSVSSGPRPDRDVMGSPDAENNQVGEGGSTKGPGPQSSLGGGRSRFLKKAAPPATNSSQSSVSRREMEQLPDTRYALSSQTAALRRLAQIESRISSRRQSQEEARQGPKPVQPSDLPLFVSQSLEAPVSLSSQPSTEKGKRFLKNKASVAVDSSSTVAAVGSPNGSDVGLRSRSRAAHASAPLLGLDTKSVNVKSIVGLESDEEDMRKLLNDSLDSTQDSFAKSSLMRTTDKALSRGSQRVHSQRPPTAAHPSSSSNPAPPRSPASSSHRHSPFRFTGHSQAHFSPSVLSLSPSPPCVPSSPHRVGSPAPSLSSMSGHELVLSLEELFPVGPGSIVPHSEMNVSSESDFEMNMRTLDDLVPDSTGLPEKTAGMQVGNDRHDPLPGSPNRHKQEQAEEVMDYPSDVESEDCRTEPHYSASQVSEHLLGDGHEEEVVSEILEEVLDSNVSHAKTADDYSSSFSGASLSCTSQKSDPSQTPESPSRGRDSRSSRRKPASTKTSLKEAAVQTQPHPLAYTWSAGLASLGPSVGRTYRNPTPGAAHTVGSETVEAASCFSPAVFALNQMLRQQLEMTRQFIEMRRRLHASVMQSLEPPNYRYVTLRDTMECIRKHRPNKPTTEEVLQQMTD